MVAKPGLLDAQAYVQWLTRLPTTFTTSCPSGVTTALRRRLRHRARQGIRRGQVLAVPPGRAVPDRSMHGPRSAIAMRHHRSNIRLRHRWPRSPDRGVGRAAVSAARARPTRSVVSDGRRTCCRGRGRLAAIKAGDNVDDRVNPACRNMGSSAGGRRPSRTSRVDQPRVTNSHRGPRRTCRTGTARDSMIVRQTGASISLCPLRWRR